MASAISYEYYSAQLGANNGLATLDGTGKIPATQIPDIAENNFKGSFADEAALVAAYATAVLGDYAYNNDTSSYWYWNAALATPAWVDQEISATAYTALSTAEKAAVPYIIVS
ncbi:MAG: hypothetical protein WCR54_08955 [Clostridia bacterium]